MGLGKKGGIETPLEAGSLGTRLVTPLCPNPRRDSPHPVSAAHVRLDVLQPFSAECVSYASGVIAPAALPHSLSPPPQLHLLPGVQGRGRGLAALCVEQQPAAVSEPLLPALAMYGWRLWAAAEGARELLPGLCSGHAVRPVPAATPLWLVCLGGPGWRWTLHGRWPQWSPRWANMWTSRGIVGLPVLSPGG